MGERVLVFRSSLLREVGYFQGLQADWRPYWNALFRLGNTFFVDRVEAEVCPEVKQVIPYVLLRHAGSLFVYERGAATQEDRLVGSWSLGVGGHISEADAGTDGRVDEMGYSRAVRREVQEEVSILADVTSESVVGAINDDQTPVGRVHFGIVHMWELSSGGVSPREAGIQRSRFELVTRLAARRWELEPWSQVALALA
jgi:predicted NUDIX family phosphoesterase